MSSEQKHNISFIPFFFFITYKILTCERHLYLPFTTYKSTTESATLRPLNSSYLFIILRNPDSILAVRLDHFYKPLCAVLDKSNFYIDTFFRAVLQCLHLYFVFVIPADSTDTLQPIPDPLDLDITWNWKQTVHNQCIIHAIDRVINRCAINLRICLIKFRS